MLQAVNTEDLLRRILMRNPAASPDEIRRSHPVFRTMSYDHLALRLTSLRDREHCPLAK